MMTAVTPVDIYTAGTISLTNGSDIVLGVGTFWEAVALRGDALWIADRSLLIKEVLADDQIRIVAPWGGDTIADQPYALSYTSWLRYSVAELQGGVRDVIAFWRMGGVRGTREVTLPIDAITVADLNKVVVYDSATAVAASIPQAAADGKLIDGWACWLKVRGAGPVTLTPVTSTINGAASLVLAQGDAAMIWSHGGDYLAAVLHVSEDGDDGATIVAQDDEPDTDLPAGSLWIDANSADLDIYQLTGSPPEWVPLGIALKGSPGVDGDDGVDGINGASALTVVRTVATANVNIASGLENGGAVSGVTLATNDLVLLTAQTAPAENGVYVVAASGAASRHASFATYDAHPGCYFSVCEGTGVADTLWRCTSDRGGTLGTTALVVSQFSSGAGSDYDYLINGDGQVNQAVAGAGIADGSYGHDQWVALTQTGAIAVSTLTDVEDGLPNMIRLTQSQATAQRMGYIQPLEANRIKRLRGKLVTMVMRLRNSTGAAIRYAIVEHTGTADTLTKDIVNDWTSGTYTTGNFFAAQSGNITVRAVGAITPAANTLTDATLSATLGSTLNNLYVFVWTEGTAAQSSTLDLAVNLRRGNASAPVVMRPFADELAEAARYFWKSYNLAIPPGYAFGAGGNLIGIAADAISALRYTVVFPARMRAAPSVIVYDGAGTAARASYYSSATNVWTNGATFSEVMIGETSVYLQSNTANALQYSFDLIANARL